MDISNRKRMNTNKKLLCISASLGNGGAERQMLMLIELLNKKGIIPIVLTYGDIKNDYPTDAKMERYNICSRSSSHLWRNLKLLFCIFKIRPDIILSYWTDPNLLAAVYKFFVPSCRVVVSERHVMQKPLSRRERFLYLLYKYVDKIVSNSQSQVRELTREYPALSSKTITISNYTDITSYQPSYSPIFSHPIKITILARYAKQKNILRFLHVVHLLNQDKDCPLFICNWYGQNKRNDVLLPYYEECVEYKEKNHLENVYLNGYERNVREIISSSDIICLPSLFEGFSNTLSEAICLGKPILASNVSDNPLLVQDGWNGYLFNPEDERNMFDVIKKMLSRPEKMLEFSKNSRRLAEKLFDEERFLNSYLNVLYGTNI